MKYRVNDAENIRLFIDTVSELCENPKVQSMREIMQHGDTSCLLHSLAVAYFSLYFVTRFHIGCDKKSLIRGALLHDYFLYDWHIKSDRNEHKLHGFTHPGAALRNAKRDFDLNDIETDIIARHMFPLTPKPPKYRESLIVCLADKYCAVIEVFQRHAYRRERRIFKRASER